MAGSARLIEPPRRLRGRVLAAAGVVPEPRWHWHTAWQAALGTALVAFAIALFQTNQTTVETAALRRQVERSGIEAARLREAVSLLQSPNLREVHFGEGKLAPPRGRLFYDSSRVLLIASNLPAPPEGKTYEMWIIPKGGKPVPAGLFSSTTQGAALHLFRLASKVLSSTDTVAVTLEAAAGADQPTTQPLIVVPL
ncbi:MAG: anti-sigma factor [Bryobacterales bacterium]|nr:anti-sigma factor [Bryobacterales bacterium]